MVNEVFFLFIGNYQYTNIAIELFFDKLAIEIVDLPINNGVFSIVMLVYQLVVQVLVPDLTGALPGFASASARNYVVKAERGRDSTSGSLLLLGWGFHPLIV